MEQEDCLLILDDYKGRRLAAQLGIALTGSLGVLIAARNLGLIPALKPYFQKIEETNFRIPQDIISKILLDFNELE
jgi:predicted nucleic acid-binding protein